MNRPNKNLINFFRGLLVLILLLNILNGALSSNPHFSRASSWGTLWEGLFFTALISWASLETANFFFGKTKVGNLPAYFWLITAGLNANDFFNDYTRLFEIPHLDKFEHALGSFLGAWIAVGLGRKILQSYNIKIPKLFFYYVVIATVNTVNVVYEIAEWIGDRYFGAHNITDIFDTSTDLLFNNIGALLLIALDLALVYYRKSANKNYAEEGSKSASALPR